ncbi:MAG TPA: glycoside hydrolase family 2 TIM barrel-domain containing protein, partial [Puia sp.]|nr:glycoside hydrolase family 2 TIM barrel-domain containing protein [Puia sp.]
MKRLVIILFLGVAYRASAGDTLDLAGTWRFRMDPHDVGETQRWFAQPLKETVHLPGSMMQNGKGDPVNVNTQWTASIYDSSWFFDPRMAKYRRADNLKLPFWLTPPKHYLGAAWYQKDIVVPVSRAGRHFVLYLERPHSETTVWLDDKPMGREYGFCTAQEFDLTGLLTAGHHVLTLRIDNRIKDINVGPDSHSLTDQTQGNWNGVVGRLLLTARSDTWIDDVQVFPDVAGKRAHVHLLIRSLHPGGSGTIRLKAESFNTSEPKQSDSLTVSYTLSEGRDSVVADLPMGEHPLLWDEFDPALYRLTVATAHDRRTVEFGMREFGIEGTHFTINGRLIHLRGMVENCEFPLTGYAAMDEASWERVFRIARSFGLNHMRFHSYCPPEAAFQAADRVGFYLQPEGPSWANHGSSLGDGKPIDRFIFDETNRMAYYYGNYASWCMLSYGNEPRGGHQVEYLTRFIDYWKAKDRRRVYTGADVGMSWPLVPANDYMVKSGPRGLNWTSLPESETDYSPAIQKFTVPYVTHEMGQWCAYPDFTEISHYTGVYKEKNFELFQELLRGQGMGDEARRFLMASGKLQVLCYKAEIEKSLRTRGSAGFQLLCLTDYSGQGTALVGVLNALWQEKGYVTAKEFRRWCGPTVPLVRMPRFVYTSKDTLSASVELYHYGAKPLRRAVIDWTLRNEAHVPIAHGSFAPMDFPIGNDPIGTINIPLHATGHFKLEVSVANTAYANDWDCWVYPAVLPTVANDVYYCTSLNDTARRILQQGGKVFLNAAGKIVKGKEIIQHFTPVFWNTSWFKMRPPHTLGILLDPKHPAFSDFPTSYHSDYQWWDVLYQAQVMHLEDFPPGFRPLVQPIDTWFLNRRLGLIFEAGVGRGRLMVSSADLGPDLPADRPASRQLYHSILHYMNTGRFQPASAVSLKVVNDLFMTPSRFVWNSYTKSSTDDLRPHPQAGAKIDRRALVGRHNVINEKVDPLSSLSVGNGKFAFTVDITGLQSFPEAYDKGVPLGTQSEWGWHSWPDSAGYRFGSTLRSGYSIQLKNPAVDWFRANPHRLQLGNIGFELRKQDGSLAGPGDLQDIRQELVLWTGEIRSHFTLEGIPVDVSTVAHPDFDEVAFRVNSPLIRTGRLKVRIRLPYPTGAFADGGDDWDHADRHRSFLVNSGDKGAEISHQLDSTTYDLQMDWSGGTIAEHQPHYFLVTPAVADSFSMGCAFTQDHEARPASWTATRKASADAWNTYWTTGAAVDFSGSTDPRAAELERRIVLSQYLMRVQEAGDYPPQETGLTYNSWYGKFHLEMHWWHEAQFALWGHPELLERSLDWYFRAAPGAAAIASRQGYKGVR